MEGNFIKLANDAEYRVYWFGDRSASKSPSISFQLYNEMPILEAVQTFTGVPKITWIIKHDHGKDLTAEYEGFTMIDAISITQNRPAITLRKPD